MLGEARLVAGCLSTLECFIFCSNAVFLGMLSLPRPIGARLWKYFKCDSHTLARYSWPTHWFCDVFLHDILFLSDDKLLVHCQVLWLSVSSLLVTLLQSQGPVSVPSVTEGTLYRHWAHFTGKMRGLR